MKMFHAYTMSERAGKKFWLRVGVAFENPDGTISVNLDAVPLSGRIRLRDWMEDPPASDPVVD